MSAGKDDKSKGRAKEATGPGEEGEHEKVLIETRHLVGDGAERGKTAYRNKGANSKIFEKDTLNDVRRLLESKDETLHELVGSGSFADVYRGVNRRLNKVIAVKIIDLMKASEHYRDKLLPQEIAIIKQLKHPRIVKIYHISQVGYKVVLGKVVQVFSNLLIDFLGTFPH